MSEIVLMLHVPCYENICKDTILKQMNRLLDVCEKTMELREVLWQFSFDDKDNNGFMYTHDARQRKCSPVFWKEVLDKRLTQINATAYFIESGMLRKNSIGLSAVLVSKADYQILPRKNGEKWLTVRIPSRLWKCIDQNVFRQATKEACIALHSTYACIDEGAPLGGIYEGWFREFTADESNIDIESRLPGIYCWQLVSEKMVHRNGSIEAIIEHVPCEHKEILLNNDEKMLWMEITQEICQATHRKRLAMRKYFENSLYPLSIAKLFRFFNVNLGGFKSIPAFILKDRIKQMKLIPLTNDEIEAIRKINS